ncbi:MAG: lactate racemase domain-containing protein [Desulfobacterales bacterium]|nr:lactate racemase domain-containing protein [Desulfobacterales bacterium]
MRYPEMIRIRQVLDVPRVENIEETVDRELGSLNGLGIKRGDRIAVTAGSRGVANIVRILRRVVEKIREAGGEPFLVPTMGSHGGGTAEGQIDVLRSLGVTEESTGAPIRSSMEVVEIGKSRFGFPVLVDKYAAGADGIVVVNRIKPHTEFEGPIESGLMKMMAIGMGKHKGCFEVHRQTVQFGYREVIPEIGSMILGRLPILFGLGIVENVYDETALIRAVPASKILETEKELLSLAKNLMARLPFEKIDVLVVDEMGKNVSGTGMDTNVIGRIMFIGEKEPERPRITRIVVLDLTEATHGNGVGIGLADYTTRKLVEKLDLSVTATNAITAMTPEKGRIPLAMATDQEAVNAAFQTIGAVQPEEAKVVHIRNTLELGEMEISRALMKEAQGRTEIQPLREIGPLHFDASGNSQKV